MIATKKWILGLLMSILIGSCTPQEKYHQFQAVAYKGWNKLDTLPFNISTSKQKSLQLEIHLRNTGEYPYQNLYLLCEENLTDSLTLTKDTIHISLAEPTGRWSGEGIGYFYQSKHNYKVINKPQISSQSQVRISSLMQDSILIGVKDIGLFIY